jgi:hypothetical protein
MNQKDLFFTGIKANLSELEIYLKFGNESIKKESEIALNYYKLQNYRKTKKIDYLKNLLDIEEVYNYLETKMLEIRKLKKNLEFN